MASIINELNLHDSWHHALRVISTNLTGHVAPLLFGPVGTTPETIGLTIYKDTKEKVEARKKSQTQPGELERRLKLMKDSWPGVFTLKLFEYFQARLLGTFNNRNAYCERSRKYCDILLDMVGEAQRENGFRFITGQFFLMMKEYICHHLPGKKIDFDNTDFVKVLEECRTRYVLANPNHKYYVDFENNTYAKGILKLVDELATDNAWITSPHCDYFILASEYLNAFAVYLYIIEYCIYTGNQQKKTKYENETKDMPVADRPKPPYYAPCFFDDLEKYRFDFGIVNPNQTRTKSMVIGAEQDLPANSRVYLKDETSGKCYTIPLPGDWTIGRKSDTHPEIDIQIETDDLCMSRNHARLTLKKNPLRKFVLTICDDFDRTNATYVWRTPLSHKFHMQLFDGDKMLLGETIFSVHIKN